MADLTADKVRRFRGVPIRGKAVIATGQTFYAGSLLAFNGSGQLVKAADTAGLRIAGVAVSGTRDANGNPGPSVAGAIGEFEFGHQEWVLEVSGSFSGASVGLDGCMIDDSGIATAAVATNDIRIGRITERETIGGAAGAWVEIARHGLAAA